ncbi:MAG: UDP-glucose 4-epimerase GalE [Bacteroidota bacterium]|jgi:UDP-glucose 4-epimerase
MKDILVTGGAGYIGSHTVVELIAAGYRPIIVDNFSNTDERLIQGIFNITGQEPILHRGDCCDMAFMRSVFQQYSFSGAIHFAAFKAVGESVDQPLKYYSNNIVSLTNLLELLKEYNVRQLVFSSSCTVYGQPDQLPIREDGPESKAASPYGFTKQIGEQILHDFYRAHPTFTIGMLRYFNPIGAHPSAQIGELPFGIPNNLVPFLTQATAGHRKALTVFGADYNTPDGSCIRDFIHVVDLAKAHVKTLDFLLGQTSCCEAINLGQGKGNSVLEVIRTFEEVNEVKVPYQIGDRRAGDIVQIWADASKAKSLLNWQTERSLGDALRDAWSWQCHLDKK